MPNISFLDSDHRYYGNSILFLNNKTFQFNNERLDCYRYIYNKNNNSRNWRSFLIDF